MTEAGRRRVAALATPNSDVTRFRAFGLVVAALTLTVVGLLAFRSGPGALVGPGPLARPHQGLACASCHEGPGEVRASAACTSCHGPHPSARPAHAALARRGELACGGCHAIHRSEDGLAFEPDGGVSHYGTGFGLSTGLSTGATYVPLVGRAACEHCHDLERATDPAWDCFARSGRSNAFSVCFDEHRRPAEPSAARSAERDGAVARARELAPTLARDPVGFESTTALAFGVLAAFLVARVSRRRAKPQGKRPGSAPLASTEPSARRLPIIDTSRCLGCNACVDACPYDVLEMSRYVAIVARPEQCCGAGSCLLRCPNGSLALYDAESPTEGPKLSARLESPERPGVYMAGDATGGSLIRSALEQGVHAAVAIADELVGLAEPTQGDGDGRKEKIFDLVVVGAGPAGLSAGLAAKKRGLSVLVLEQASIAESIQRFSRDKLVLDAVPGDGVEVPLWIGDAKKEELLRRWQRTVRSSGLGVRENVRVVGIDGAGVGSFVVRALEAGGELRWRARRVLLATGRRGSPRKLAAPIPEAALHRVHYELSDARAFVGRRVVVVGLGDVAMETALALAHQPGTTVTVVHRGRGFSRGRQRNVEAIGRLVAEGRIGLLFDAEIRSIGVERLMLSVGEGERAVAYDALFVHVGAESSNALALLERVSPLPSRS
jgi:thioredoxin reductase/NAD-dependent dihydropyrimidine dehydrogenase PreA subunit